MAVLNTGTAWALKQMAAAGMTHGQAVSLLFINDATARDVMTGRTWGHV
jgi:hypothetical protein